jgi:hypothetical protein
VKDIQAVVRQITASVTFLPLLEDPCEHSTEQQQLQLAGSGCNACIAVRLPHETFYLFFKGPWNLAQLTPTTRGNGVLAVRLQPAWLVAACSSYPCDCLMPSWVMEQQPG